MVREYDEAGQLLQVIGELTVSSSSTWYPYPDRPEVLYVSPEGHADSQSLVIDNSTEAALFSTRDILFRLTTGHQYQVSGWAKGTNMTSSSQCRFTLGFYSLPEGATLQSRDRASLEAQLDQHLAFGETHDVPMLVTECGLTHDSLEYGGITWLGDVLSAFDERALGAIYYAYHSNSMGLYGDESRAPSEETAVTPLLDFFRNRAAEP